MCSTGDNGGISRTAAMRATEPHAEVPIALPPLKLAFLISGGGTTLANMIRAIESGLPATIVVVIASRADVGGIAVAREAGIPTLVIDRRECSGAETFSDRIFKAAEEHGVNLICLGGWLQLLVVPPKWVGRVVNIHPSLLPKFGGRGMYGRHVHSAVIAAGESESGCTVHLVNNECDAGPVLLQLKCPVLPDDTPDTLAARVFALEQQAYPTVVRRFVDNAK